MAMAPEADKVNRHAILVGIDAYDSESFPALKGCVNDVTEISKILKESFGEQCHFHRLIASAGHTPNPPTEPDDQWPTAESLLACFDRVIYNAKQGHHLYFHFSGHSVLEPLLQQHGWNWAPGDYLALVLLHSADASQTTSLHSAELAQKIQLLVKKGVTVTVVLDCCKSGGVLRGGGHSHGTSSTLGKFGTTPEWPLDPEHPQGKGAVGESRQAPSWSMRKASMDVNWLIDPKGYAILAACDRTEAAYHARMPDDNSRYGLLTYFLLTTFYELGGVGGSMRHLFDSISTKVKAHRGNHKHKTQNPVFKGNGEQPFFGCASPACVGDFPITKRLAGPSQAKYVFGLRAGRAHGIVKGDRFSLHPLGAGSKVQSLTAKAIDVRGITSDLEVCAPKAFTDTIATGWMVTTETRLALREFAVWLNLGAPQLRKWGEAMEMRPTLSQYSPQDEGDWTFMVTQSGENSYELHGKEHAGAAALASVSVTQDLERAIQWLLDQVEHLARFKLLRGLTNLECSEQLSILGFFSVQIVYEHGKTRKFDPGCIHTTNGLQAACSKPKCSCVIPVLADEELSICVENSRSDGKSLYFYVYDMCYDWEVQEQHKSDRQCVPAGKGTDNPCRKFVKFSLEDGQDECEEVLKVFLTSQATSFRTWIMPVLGQDSSANEPESSQRRGNFESEDWVVLTFRLCVSRAKRPAAEGFLRDD